MLVLVVIRRTVAEAITSMCDSFKLEIKEKLALITNIAVTTDIWSDRRMRGYVAVTAHYVAPNSSTLSTTLLSCEQIKGRLQGIFIG